MSNLLGPWRWICRRSRRAGASGFCYPLVNIQKTMEIIFFKWVNHHFWMGKSTNFLWPCNGKLCMFTLEGISCWCMFMRHAWQALGVAFVEGNSETGMLYRIMVPLVVREPGHRLDKIDMISRDLSSYHHENAQRQGSWQQTRQAGLNRVCNMFV